MVDAEPNSLRDGMYLLCKRRRRITLMTLAAAAGSWIYTSSVGNDYTARARVVVASPAAAPQAPTVIFQEPGAAARNEAEVLRDPALIRNLMPVLERRLPAPPSRIACGVQRLAAWWRGREAALGLVAPETPAQILAERLIHALRTAAVKGTDVVALSFTWSDPVFAADALNVVLSAQRSLASRQADAAQAVVLAQIRVHDAQLRLAQLDSQLGTGGDHDVATIEREKDRVGSRLAGARTEADAIHLERESVRQRLETVEKAYRGGGWVDNPDALGSPSGATVDPAFVDLLNKREKLLEHSGPDTTRLHAVDRQIGEARNHAYEITRRVYGGRLKSLDARLSDIATQTSADQTLQRTLDERLVEVESTQRSRDETAAQLRDLARHEEDSRRQADLAQQDNGLRVLSQATPPAEPDWPGPLLVIGLVALGGFLGGLASAIRAERTLLTIDRPRDIARLLHIPVLASVPELR